MRSFGAVEVIYWSAIRGEGPSLPVNTLASNVPSLRFTNSIWIYFIFFPPGSFSDSEFWVGISFKICWREMRQLNTFGSWNPCPSETFLLMSQKWFPGSVWTQWPGTPFGWTLSNFCIKIRGPKCFLTHSVSTFDLFSTDQNQQGLTSWPPKGSFKASS